uniref:uncharacterized protein LOC107000840 isoform X3 n=1 Tax=Macaca mulatta TaxID=9544 RepID=UPI00075FF2E5|nr:PREDICTED: uncharacterized protein LOC107126692 isoform X5 [Macaca fascicularis]XP_028685255.1 uncharacterized protein LOC107000840 isoform X3 [Macaca mulatta]
MEGPSGKRPSCPAFRQRCGWCACAARGLWPQRSFGSFTGCVAENNERGFKVTGQEGFCSGKRRYRHRHVCTQKEDHKNRDKTAIYKLSREGSEEALLPTP